MLSDKWGQPVVIENRAGAGGVVGTDAVAKAAPDGYTLLVTYAGSQAINPALYPKIPFDSVKDFTLVATLASTPFILIVNPNLPAKSLAEFIALARAKPDALTYASSGNGSVNHLLGEMVKSEAGIKMLHVPYRGVAPAITDVIGGQVDSAFSSVPSVLQMVQSEKVRALAVSSGKRIGAAPDIPTIAEQGFPDFDVNPWWGILAPAGIDNAIVRKISADVEAILRTREMIDFLAAQGAEPLITSPEAFLKMLQADIVKWEKVVKSAGVTLN
jgi:tripartite-type tricarboxylate transporter receptor subunit TctC